MNDVPRDRAPVRLSVPAVPENLTVVRQALTGMALAAGLGDEELEDLKVAVTEACTNVVLHAYPHGGNGRMEVEAWADVRSLVVHVRDEGRGINPDLARKSPGLGLGLKLITALARDVRISADPDAGTSVWMVFGGVERDGGDPVSRADVDPEALERR